MVTLRNERIATHLLYEYFEGVKFTVTEFWRKSKDLGYKISRSTIYRVLTMFVQQGVVMMDNRRREVMLWIA